MGSVFMKVALNWIYKKFAERFWGYWGYTEKDNNKDTCLVWKWDGEDLVLEQDTYFPYVAFNAKLALKMGWFTQNQAGGYEVGPNLIMSYVDGLVPASNQADFVSPSKTPLYYRSTVDSGYTPNVTWLWLSMRVNWKLSISIKRFVLSSKIPPEPFMSIPM